MSIATWRAASLKRGPPTSGVSFVSQINQPHHFWGGAAELMTQLGFSMMMLPSSVAT
jgi:hypothetical protein